MKLTRTIAISLAAFACVSAQAVTLAAWNFNDDNLTVDRQASGVNATMSTTFEAANVVYFGGTDLGADASDASGSALSLQGGTNQVNNGATVTIQFDATNLVDLSLSYANRGTGTGFNSQVVAYSTDGVNYTNFGSTPNQTSTWTLHSFDISALDGASTAFIQYTFDGSTGATGNNRLDNIVIGGEAVPEPATMTLLGLGVAAFAARKRKKA